MSPSNAAALRDEVKEAFAEAGLNKVADDILSQCVALAVNLHITPKQMAETWEAFSLNRNVPEFNEISMASFRKVLVKDSDVSAELLLNNKPPGAVVSRPSLGKHTADGLPAVTPPAKKFHAIASNQTPAAGALLQSYGGKRRVSMTPGPPFSLNETSSNLPKYSERTNAGKVLVTYNPNQLEAASSSKRSTPKCSISYDFPTNVKKPYRHMFTTVQERAKALDRHLVELGVHMMERYGIQEATDETSETGIAPLEAVGVPRQDAICCIGRICNSAHEGRINATSILLEGSRNMSGGSRVELDLSYMQSTKSSYSLFPGQVVAVEGINTSGRKMVAHRICEGAAHEPVKSSVHDLLRFHHDDSFQDGTAIKIVAVAGPYSTSDNLEFEPLMDLMNFVKADKPDVVILAGPFVDMNHKAVASGQTTLQYQDGEEVLVPFDTFFANKVASLLEDLFADDSVLQTQFVLIPSLEDANAEWVYPQAPFTDRVPGGSNLSVPGAEGIEAGTLGLQHVEVAGREGKSCRRVHCVPNPCTLKINEIVVGVTSTDVVFHLSGDETNANLEPGSRLARISQHMLQQRSYYPLFPSFPMTNLDFKHMDQWKMPCQPDLFIVPSKLTGFARPVLDSTLVVNPGNLSRDSTGGSYAVIEIHPMKRDVLENAGGRDVLVPHDVHQRSRVEIKRI